MTSTPRGLFVDELQRLYYVEQELCSELDVLASDITIDTLDGILITDCREQLHDRVNTHTDETSTHLERLESVFDIIGEEPTTRPVPEVDGWISDKEQFNNIILNDELRPLYYLGTVMKGEELEHSMYETILRLARNLEGEGERQQISELLEENAADENEMLEDIKSVADSDSVRRLLEASQVSSRRPSSLDRSQTRTLSINIETLDDLFVYQLCNMLSIEQTTINLFEKMSSNADSAALIDEYYEGATHQVDHLKKVFDAIGAGPTDSQNHMMSGLAESYLNRPDPALIEGSDILDFGTALAVTRIKMQCYDELLMFADQIGYSNDVVDVLTTTECPVGEACSR